MGGLKCLLFSSDQEVLTPFIKTDEINKSNGIFFFPVPKLMAPLVREFLKIRFRAVRSRRLEQRVLKCEGFTFLIQIV